MTTSAKPLASPAEAEPKVRRRLIPEGTTRNDNLAGWIFISPAVLLIFIFGLFPIGYAIYMSLHRWRIQQGRFVGIENYADVVGDWFGLALFVAGFAVMFGAYWLWTNAFRQIEQRQWLLRWSVSFGVLAVGMFIIASGWARMMDAGDEDFLYGLTVTFWFAMSTVPVQLTLGLILAYVLFQSIRAKQWYRMIFFLPYVAPEVAMAVVFRVVFSARETSLANQFVGLFGIEPQRWVTEPEPFINQIFGLNLEGFIAGPSMALVSVALLGIWKYTGYNAVIFLAGLGSIPKDLYEAAKVDGATEWHLFRHITLPLLSPVTFYLSILAFIGTFKAFNSVYVMRDPFSQGTVDVASIVIFDTFYKASRYGLAAAQAIILFMLILALTAALRNIFEKRVFYG